MAMQSLKSLRIKMECIRFDSARSGNAQGGSTCSPVVTLCGNQTHIILTELAHR